MTILSVEVI